MVDGIIYSHWRALACHEMSVMDQDGRLGALALLAFCNHNCSNT